MGLSLPDALEAIECDLPGALVPADALRELRRLATWAPPLWRSFGFECRIGGQGDAVDLGVSVVPEAGGREALARHAGSPQPERTRDAHPHWERLGAFARQWSEPDSLLAAWVPFVFLEYDADPKEACVVPSVFAALDAPLAEAADRPHVTAACAAAALLAGPSHASPGPRIRDCFDALPADGVVLHVGMMLGRPAADLRLSVLLSADGVAPYLDRTRGSETAAAASAALAALPGWLTRAQLDFDIGHAASTRVGFSVRPTAPCRKSWEALFADLIASGCCERERARLLLAWPGEPAGLEARTGRRWRRELSHVKLVCSASRPLEAKAYFGLAPEVGPEP